MKLLRRGNSDKSETSAETSAAAEVTAATEFTEAPATTPGKGRPTPKRREAQKRRGPVAPAPMTSKEARARRKATRGDKADRKAASAARREAAADRRARMMAGEEAYLLPRDRGPVRGFVRDFVDARRNLVGMFMPLALVLIFSMFLTPQLQSIVTLAMLIMLILMAGEGYFIGRMINKRVQDRFPENTESSFKLGWYAFVRASQIRRMRAPKPRVSIGDAV